MKRMRTKSKKRQAVRILRRRRRKKRPLVGWGQGGEGRGTLGGWVRKNHGNRGVRDRTASLKFCIPF